MQGRKKWMAMILAVGLTGSLAACGTGSGADKALLVGVAMPTKEQDRWVADGNNLRKEFTSLGFQVEMQYATDDPAAQAKQIQTMIDDHVDALVIGAVDGTALKAVLAEAHAAHIPIIAYDRLIRDSGDVDYYASFNNWQVGVMEGTALLQGMGVIDAGGKPTGKTGVNIEVFAGSPDDNNATFFYDGAMSVVRPFIDSGAITVPSGQVERADVAIQGWKGEVAGQRMTTLLAPVPGRPAPRRCPRPERRPRAGDHRRREACARLRAGRAGPGRRDPGREVDRRGRAGRDGLQGHANAGGSDRRHGA